MVTLKYGIDPQAFIHASGYSILLHHNIYVWMSGSIHRGVLIKCIALDSVSGIALANVYMTVNGRLKMLPILGGWL